MNPASGNQTGRLNAIDAASGWDYFLRAGLSFLAFETVIIFLLGGPLLGDSDSTLLFFAIAGAGAIGYLMLGVFAGSWISVLFLVLPIVIAVAVGGTTADGFSASETPLYVSWTFLTLYFFGPAWLFGLLISFVRRTYASDLE